MNSNYLKKYFNYVTDTICDIVERPKPPKVWYLALGIALSMLATFAISIYILFTNGIGVYGNNNMVGWA